MANGVIMGEIVPDSGLASDSRLALSPGFDHLPASIRRSQRFGGAAAARLAEALALRREIDAVAGRLASWVAGARGTAGNEEAVLQATWVHLRRAGLALRAEIDRAEGDRAETDSGPRDTATATPNRGRLTDPEQAA